MEQTVTSVVIVVLNGLTTSAYLATACCSTFLFVVSCITFIQRSFLFPFSLCVTTAVKEEADFQEVVPPLTARPHFLFSINLLHTVQPDVNMH